METQQKLDEGKALYNTTSTSIQRVMDQANLINYYDATSISNMKQSWANTSRDYSNSTLVLNEAGVSGAKWFIDKSYEVGIGNPVITAWNLMISLSSLALNSEIKNSVLFSQYIVGNNVLVAAKDVYLTNNVKLTQIRFGQLSVTESEFQEIQNNLRSSVAVMYLVRGQLAAYERELTISFFSDGSALIPSASQSSQWKKLGIDFQDYKNITLNEFIR
ncbi:MAG TPA: hypothetical protein VFC84_12795 [Desulfosporosinus sp.]|nr:hypothetical protein [Desulfosporosinus sp.]